MDKERTLFLVRNMAKEDKWQSLYNRSKELHFKLFKNKRNFTGIQIEFLNFLSFYSSIFTDIALGEVDEKVLDNNIYEDAYMYYKLKAERKDKEKEFEEKYKMNRKKDKVVTNSQWIFKNKKD